MPGFEDYYPTLDDSEDGSSQRDAIDDSVENVEDLLVQQERELREAGHLEASVQGDPLDDEDDESDRLETAHPLYDLSEALQDRLGTIGLFNADAITTDVLAEIDPDILTQLNPTTVENLYYDTFLKSRTWLGTEPIDFELMVRQAEAHKAMGSSLEEVQRRQTMDNMDKLRTVHINPNQILDLLSGEPATQQLINRMAFFLEDPKLQATVAVMKEVGAIEGPWSIEEVVISAQNTLREGLDKVEKGDVEYREAGMIDGIYEKKYARITHRIGSSIAIGEFILEDLRGATTYKDFLRETLSEE